MGLDMYAHHTAEKITKQVDFRTKEDSEFFYWRKHPNLHGWMQQLYKERGGSDPDFNCHSLLLEPRDIDALEKAVKGNALPFTEGFFFGESVPEDKEDDLQFIKAARDAHAKGLNVFYFAWW